MKTWKYCGGISYLDKDGEIKNNSHTNYFPFFKKLQHLVPRPPLEKCLCNQKIEQNCFITNSEEDRLLVVGSCCIKRFVVNCSRTCGYCLKPHRNRTNNLCNECREYGGFCYKCCCFYKNKILDLNEMYLRCGYLSEDDKFRIKRYYMKPIITTEEPEPNSHFLDLNPSCASDDTIPYDD